MNTTDRSTSVSTAADPSTDRLIGIRDVSDWLGVSPSTIRRLVAAGAFPAPLLIGHQHRWRPSDVAAYVDRKRRGRGGT